MAEIPPTEARFSTTGIEISVFHSVYSSVSVATVADGKAQVLRPRGDLAGVRKHIHGGKSGLISCGKQNQPAGRGPQRRRLPSLPRSQSDYSSARRSYRGGGRSRGFDG